MTNEQGFRPRDTQRSRLYDAEDALRGRRVSAAAKRHLTDTQHVAGMMVYDRSQPTELRPVGYPGGVTKMEPMHPLVPMKCPTVEAVQAYMDDVTKSAWYQRRWHQTFRYVNGKGSHGAWGRVTVRQEHRRSEAIILHEMAHTLTGPQYAWHGPEFAGVLLTLVKHVMGAEHAADLRASYKKHKVRVSMKAVPAPTRQATPRAEQEKRERAAAKRQRDEKAQQRARVERERVAGLRRYSARQEAAAVIRQAVKDGFYGPAGSKPRAQALATARALEKGKPALRATG